MTYPNRPGSRQSDATLGALFVDASRDLSALIRSEIALAKAEIRQDAKNGAIGGAMFGAAAFLGVLAVVLLSIAAALVLRAWGVADWLAFGLVAAFYLFVAAILGLVGKKSVSKVGPPERTLRTSKETAAFLKNPRSNGSA